MDEQTIKRAAEDALGDLQLDNEIKTVCKSGNKDEWCIQFAGNYGQFCDKFQDQFEKENSPELIREKIKRYLLKQVSKIRSSSGRSRRARGMEMADKKRDENFTLNTPLKMIEDVFDRATEIAGGALSVASSVAETARDAVTNVTSNVRPVVVEVERTTKSRTRKKTARASTKKKGGATSGKTRKATKTASRPSAGKKATKASRKGKGKGKVKRGKG